MENAILIGLARQMTLRRAMDVAANNIANMSTAGFKLERPVVASEPVRPQADGHGRLQPILFVDDWAVARDFAPGRMERTDRPLDVAIKSEGFFNVETSAGERYTRDGRFTLDADGALVTTTGDKLLDDGGSEIRLDPNGSAPVISGEGGVNVDGARVATIGVVRFADLSKLEKTGDGLFRADGAAPEPADEAQLAQGFVESSNVEPISEITRMIETSRAYESVSKMIQQQEDLKRRAVDKLAGV